MNLLTYISSLFSAEMSFSDFRDPDSGLIRNDLCLGRTRRDCDEMMWKTIDFNPNVTMLKKLTEGVPVWIKIKAVNNGIELLCIIVSMMREHLYNSCESKTVLSNFILMLAICKIL